MYILDDYILDSMHVPVVMFYMLCLISDWICRNYTAVKIVLNIKLYHAATYSPKCVLVFIYKYIWDEIRIYLNINLGKIYHLGYEGSNASHWYELIKIHVFEEI